MFIEKEIEFNWKKQNSRMYKIRYGIMEFYVCKAQGKYFSWLCKGMLDERLISESHFLSVAMKSVEDYIMNELERV